MIFDYILGYLWARGTALSMNLLHLVPQLISNVGVLHSQLNTFKITYLNGRELVITFLDMTRLSFDFPFFIFG